MQVVEAEARSVGLLSQKKNNLPEIISNEAFVRVAGKTSEGEADQFLEKQKVLLLV